ncbi:DUF5317 domain-containing protein [Brevibacillus sp. SYP-B805]|uniref:DUF5317 domain-containing protein n=1 Tax=Brevibacillus sp. SYP-B805 TaxID=1578199 RepID=UPI0013EA5417|nr:DUF5317 domain-containing protein [Brevibacillus sp. SYP-B805]NGQ95675.1 DUF5317 domain-containing protein [Brevibacillus sp. SYP-B805]
MFIDIIILAFIVAFLRGGRIQELPKFEKVIFLVASIVLQIGSALLPKWGGFFVSIAYLFTLLFFFYNREHEDIRIFLIGWLLNAAVIWANLGRMPIDLEQARKLPYSPDPIINGEDFKHKILTDDTPLSFLADIIYMPFPLARVISIGDIFIMLGAFLLVQRIMNKPISLIRLREGKNYAAKN